MEHFKVTDQLLPKMMELNSAIFRLKIHSEDQQRNKEGENHCETLWNAWEEVKKDDLKCIRTKWMDLQSIYHSFITGFDPK